MDPEHRRKFKDPELVSSLASCINFDVLAPSLLRRGILTAAMVADIWRLPKRGPLAYDRFLSVLREHNMLRAVSLLTGNLLQQEPPSGAAPTGVPAAAATTHVRAFGGGDARVDFSLSNGHSTMGGTSNAELRVIPAKDWKHGDDIYSMVHSPRGKCIIINNSEFGPFATRREGSELDVRRMEALFKAFHFDCIVRSNLRARDMKALLSWVAQEEQQRGADCLVVVLMSHGKRDMIDGIDGEQLHLVDDIYQLFNNDNCPALQGKPKLFFVQACRGAKHDGGTKATYDTTDAGKIPEGDAALDKQLFAQETRERLTSWSDMYFAYATIPNYVALKNEVIGTWFLSAVYTVFSEHACTMHLEKLMRKVHEAVMRRISHDGGKQTPSVELQGWTKKLYFNPGLYVERTAAPTPTTAAT
ncbi:hypothetical protein HPB48_013069 [Haemaphysalis longicornis]|uniref:Caspase-2 n=1 Tax=Haemaphysalis longicornis TaxID=44386 RepID=A0A9J6GPM6_HAELO|nr:hypothetical protein HPB48_013069 [Haemaphysalis longicornis]